MTFDKSIKITKIRKGVEITRINFKYNNELYSVQHDHDIVYLRKFNGKSFDVISSKEFEKSLWVSDVQDEKKKTATISQLKLEPIVEFLNFYFSEKDEENSVKELKKQIENRLIVEFDFFARNDNYYMKNVSAEKQKIVSEKMLEAKEIINRLLADL